MNTIKLGLIILFTLSSNHLFAQCPGGHHLGAMNLVVNGDFSNGNFGFETSYTYTNDSSFSGGPMVDEGEFGITANAQSIHHQFSPCKDHSEGGNMMVVNGSSVDNETIWSQKITVKQNTDYVFSCWIASAHEASPAILQFSVNGKNRNDAILAAPSTCDWKQFSTLWKFSKDEEITISIINKNTVPMGNDFLLDDISFFECLPPLPKPKPTEEPKSDLDQITLEDIFFDKERFELKATSYKQLDKLAGLLIEHENLEVKIAGHTDSKGEDEVNMKLSFNRADAVAAYLVEKGVKSHKIKAVGYGKSKPVATNETEEGKQLNRRVIFRLLEN
jgi:outer membrane protein OmpA-like peptidoglycan-associated protein